jgi:threonine synthase
VGVKEIHLLGMVNETTVCLATAHEAKFPDAVNRAVEKLPTPPEQLSCLEGMPTRRVELACDLAVVQKFVEDCVFKK